MRTFHEQPPRKNFHSSTTELVEVSVFLIQLLFFLLKWLLLRFNSTRMKMITKIATAPTYPAPIIYLNSCLVQGAVSKNDHPIFQHTKNQYYEYTEL